ncbi:hypothetical protein HX025_12750 [Myroides odoratimimus]|uniref:Uncharacterized protein n=3 Tax=Flavobacteriaceae TaxID=49546 RepID=A0A0U3EXM2_9FLAO|nr:hypothetical protein MYRA21_1021 [Myroides sp. A21]ALU25498.1 hypothetical protein AS202_04735 [Myroides odoratimimus]EHO06861.1 hypothetical protein HMPREF9712_03066 [Myroides odoratimimus CCUG 10230]MDM1035463.1 hypothetical protein [Myroides odoratimimus]MDM1065759.1 hypothetical protein [Myroides odoratimimus]
MNMKKHDRYMLVFVVLLLALLLMSCGSRKTAINMQPTTTEQITQTVEEVKRDTVLIIPADKSQYVAELAVQGNKIVVKDANIKRSKNKVLQPPKVQLQNNKLIVDCESEAQRLFFEWKDKFIKEQKVVETRIPVAVPLSLSWWQQTQIWLGRGFMLLVALGMTGFIIKSRI